MSTKAVWLEEVLPPDLTTTPTFDWVSPIGGVGAATVSSVADADSTRASCPPKVTTLPRVVVSNPRPLMTTFWPATSLARRQLP